jgi:hypothetical protein
LHFGYFQTQLEAGKAAKGVFDEKMHTDVFIKRVQQAIKDGTQGPAWRGAAIILPLVRFSCPFSHLLLTLLIPPCRLSLSISVLSASPSPIDPLSLSQNKIKCALALIYNLPAGTPNLPATAAGYYIAQYMCMWKGDGLMGFHISDHWFRAQPGLKSEQIDIVSSLNSVGNSKCMSAPPGTRNIRHLKPVIGTQLVPWSLRNRRWRGT